MLLLYFQLRRKKEKNLFIDTFLMGPPAPSTTMSTERATQEHSRPPGQLNLLSSKAPQQRSDFRGKVMFYMP